jgi:hypothetical protein
MDGFESCFFEMLLKSSAKKYGAKISLETAKTLGILNFTQLKLGAGKLG